MDKKKNRMTKTKNEREEKRNEESRRVSTPGGEGGGEGVEVKIILGEFHPKQPPLSRCRA